MKASIKWRWSLLLVVLGAAIMQFQGRSLKTAASPMGIIELEFTNHPTKLNSLLASWDPNVVRLNIFIDFGFILAYTFFFICSARLLKEKIEANGLKIITNTSIALAYFAALFDVLENSLMLASLSGNYNEQSLLSTAYIAKIKFGFIGLILIILTCSSIYSLLNKKPSKQRLV